MRKESFSKQHKSKSLPRGDDPFQIRERINDNAHKLDLPYEYNVNATFNVSDFSFLHVDNYKRANHFKERENNEDRRASSKDSLHVSTRRITSAIVRRIKKTINKLIQELWTKEWVNISPNLHEGTRRHIGICKHDPSSYRIGKNVRMKQNI